MDKGDSSRRLWFAASEGDTREIERLLVAGGADVKWRRPDSLTGDQTPLQAAAFRGHVEAVRALLQAGADVNGKDKDGWTALQTAARVSYHGRQLEIVQVLLDAGADVNASDDNQTTALHLAAYEGSVQLMHMLLQKGADKDAMNTGAGTPLHVAARENQLEAVRALLQAGANADTKNKDGKTPEELVGGLVLSSRKKAIKQALVTAAQRSPRDGKTPQELLGGLFLSSKINAIKQALVTAAQVQTPSPKPSDRGSNKVVLYTGGTVTLPSPLTANQANVVVGALVMAGLQKAVQFAGAVATCDPVALVMAPVQLLQAVKAMLEQGLYIRERLQRIVARIAAMEPALEQLGQELQPPGRAGTPVHLVQSLCNTLLQLAHVLVRLQELQRKLQTKGEGMLRRVLELLQAGGYEQDVAGLEQELRDCVSQLSLLLNIAQFTQVAQVLWAREELQVGLWQQQSQADRARDLQQLEGLLVQAAGGIKELQKELAEQRLVLDGQVVGLQQVAEWLQRMHASSGIINAQLQQLHSKMDDISDQVAVMSSMQEDFGAKVDQLICYMSRSSSRAGKGVAPSIVIARSRITMAADALAQGTSGGFGTVVKALQDGNEVAVKVYNHRVLGEIDSEEAMEEALLLSKANHPNVVRCFGIVHDPDAPEGSSLHGSLVMEWVGGGTLYKWLQGNHRSVGLKTRVQLALNVAAGMCHLHERRLVHGDLKPQNVLLTAAAPGGEVPQAKICDFGLAKHTSTSAQFYYQQKKAYTAIYTSPERIANFRRTFQDDIYAFGILLYFIATGRTPFTDIPAQQLEWAIGRGARPDMDPWVAQQQRSSGAASIEGQAAAGLAQLAQQCWDAQPAKRPPCQELLQGLAGILRSLGV